MTACEQCDGRGEVCCRCRWNPCRCGCTAIRPCLGGNDPDCVCEADEFGVEACEECMEVEA